jgi:hypothetical protein
MMVLDIKDLLLLLALNILPCTQLTGFGLAACPLA